MKTIAEIENAGYTEAKTSACRGYVSRKLEHGTPEPYKGRYGIGWKVYFPRWDTTQFCYVTYYTK